MQDMVRTFSRRQATPAANAAAHLLRIGFVILVVAAPIASVGSRRGFLVLAPLGIGIVFLAAMVDGRAGRTFNGVGRFLASAAGVAAIVLLAWAALSLGWTSARTLGGDRLVKIFATLLLAVFACVSLPNRMRASNLYLIPIGVLLAALLAIAAAVYGLLPFRAFDPDQPTLERAAAAISLWVLTGSLARETGYDGTITLGAAISVTLDRNAALRGAQMLVDYGLWHAAGHRFHLRTFPPMFPRGVSGRAEREEEIRRLAQYMISCQEEIVRSCPTQWFMFRRFWPAEDISPVTRAGMALDA